MRISIPLSLLLLPLALCLGQSSSMARPYQGYVLAFELTPDDDGNVTDCKLRGATHYSAGEVKDAADLRPSASLLESACSTFSRWKVVEVHRDRRGVIQTVDAPWPCFIRDDAPDKIDCHPSGRVPVD